MIRQVAASAVLMFLVAGCSKSNKMERGQQQYQTVQEGSAAGVTSTINAPGETPALATATNADTTTNFTIPTNPNPMGNSTTGTTAAGTVPSTSTYFSPAVAPPTRAQRSRNGSPGMVMATPPIVTDTIGSTTPAMPRVIRTRPQPEPPPETTSTQAEPDTTSSGQTNTAPPVKKKPVDETRKPEDQQEPPPPPPPTDTIGARG